MLCSMSQFLTKISIFGLLRKNIYCILFEYLFLLQRTWFSSSTSQTQPSTCLYYNSFLRPTHSTILRGHVCNYQLDIYTRVLEYNTSLKLNSLLYYSVYFLLWWENMFYSPEPDSRSPQGPLQLLLYPFLFTALLVCHRPLLLLSNDWNSFSFQCLPCMEPL